MKDQTFFRGEMIREDDYSLNPTLLPRDVAQRPLVMTHLWRTVTVIYYYIYDILSHKWRTVTFITIYIITFVTFCHTYDVLLYLLHSVTFITLCYIYNVLLHLLHSFIFIMFCYIYNILLHLWCTVTFITFCYIYNVLLHLLCSLQCWSQWTEVDALWGNGMLGMD